MGGVAYTWDNNGNLLNDGTSTYSYDAANRLTSVSNQSSVSSYQYNGLGDRLSQTVDSVTTNYVLDLNAGLTQVLSDGTNTYLYGNGRIGELQAAGFAYHLGDALGGVRQLTDASGGVTLARSFEPYGETLTSAGSGNTVFQFTGEARDTSALTFLRARYLSTATGRFLSRDTWGDYTRPLTLNGFSYVENNPIRFIDPSGERACQDSSDPECIQKAQDLLATAQSLKAEVSSGIKLPVEAFAELADHATFSFDDIDDMMWGMTNVLLGVDPNQTEVWKLGFATRYGITGNSYFVRQDWLPYRVNGKPDRGDWRPDYWDGSDNQAYHFWYFVAVQYNDNAAYANAANIGHDPYWLEGLCGDDLKKLNAIPVVGQRITPLFVGTSQEDYRLSQKGMELGNGLWWAFDIVPPICVGGRCTPAVKPPGSISNVGQWIRANLK